LLIVIFVVMERKLKIKSQAKQTVNYTVKDIAFRAILSGTIISSAVLGAKFIGPLAGGIIAAFPGSFISTIIIANRSGSLDFAKSISKSLVIGVLLTTVSYVAVVRFLYAEFGLGGGTIIAYSISGVIAIVAYKYVYPKIN